MKAAENGRANVVQLLLSAGANKEAADKVILLSFVDRIIILQCCAVHKTFFFLRGGGEGGDGVGGWMGPDTIYITTKCNLADRFSSFALTLHSFRCITNTKIMFEKSLPTILFREEFQKRKMILLNAPPNRMIFDKFCVFFSAVSYFTVNYSR